MTANQDPQRSDAFVEQWRSHLAADLAFTRGDLKEFIKEMHDDAHSYYDNVRAELEQHAAQLRSERSGGEGDDGPDVPEAIGGDADP